MPLGTLSSVAKLFESKPTEEEQDELAKEIMLYTLARATAADTNIKQVEVEKVQEVLLNHLGIKYDLNEIRITAKSESFENRSLRSVLATASSKMRNEDKVETIQALAEVINVDGRVSEMEIAFFNEVATALSLTPAEILGLRQEVSVRGG
ncbi:MAG TPA: hypothetical protein DER02_00085 [Gammaproteobacteria bacterium]|jgi:uncharacterized tellurite resistance protein B-like protein|nr:hypothetical protein [Gammaproteobacteria bacterium]|tara:strand:+ start:2341 stop:2793 length:453 start_codon:yes stop_codon:yes gene_type:complete